MDLLEGMQLVKVAPSLREQIERKIAGVHHKVVVNRLRRFREGLERGMQPEPWTLVESPMVIMLADVCGVLGLDEGERAGVLGVEGVLALADTLETSIRPVFSPWLPMNERQAKAMRYAREHNAISLSVYRQICPHWSDETLRLDLVNLVRRKLLVKNGHNKGTSYVLPE